MIIRCYAELNDYIPDSMRQRDFPLRLPPDATLRDALVTLGIPVEMIDMALVDGHSVPLSFQPADDSRVSLYPVFESFDISSTSNVTGAPRRRPRFALDAHLFALGRYLRMLGFDTVFDESLSGRRLIALAIEERRTLLSKARATCGDPALTHAFHVKADDVIQQLMDVLERFDLVGLIRPLTRCMVCNGALRPREPVDVADELPPFIRDRFDAFQWCDHCRHVYWAGGHHQRMTRFIRDLVEQLKT